MQIWTTFTPRKVSWELTYVLTKSNTPSSDWQRNIGLIHESLNKLKSVGISGIRLVIFPSELTGDGVKFNWQPIDIILDLCFEKEIYVDLCIGPFQYPHYPGIYLPQKLIKKLSSVNMNIDDDPEFYKFGLEFLKQQMYKFGADKRIRGLHFANEWPDRQKVEGRRDLKLGVSEKFMIEAGQFILNLTKKPISLNTNIDISDYRKITKTFGRLFSVLSGQVKLGFDIYPTQNKWRKNPFLKFGSLVFDYPKSFKSIQSKNPECEMYFAEVEAQPWGSGQSWHLLITQESTPQQKILNYWKGSLEETFDKYILGTDCQIVSLWGSDFWLAADMMGIKWPMDQVKVLANKYSRVVIDN